MLSKVTEIEWNRAYPAEIASVTVPCGPSSVSATTKGVVLLLLLSNWFVGVAFGLDFAVVFAVLVLLGCFGLPSESSSRMIQAIRE